MNYVAIFCLLLYTEKNIIKGERKHDKAFYEKLYNQDKDTFDEIVEYYLFLLKELKIDNFSTFKFEDYEAIRVVNVDGKEYDFDEEFCHDDTECANALCAIDCLCADLGLGEEKVSLVVESLINAR